MKYKYFLIFLSLFIAFSCYDDKAAERKMKARMNEAFKVYIRDNDLRKDFVTKLEKVETLSFVQLTDSVQENEKELYEAKVHMLGTTARMNSVKVYNLNDTVTCYFDENIKMLRLVNPND